MRDLASLTADDFSAAVDSIFEIVDDDSESLELRLTDVVLLADRPGRRRSFSLWFRGPPSRTLDHITHRVMHPEMGEFELFLGPIASDSEGVSYEAVFA